MSHRSDLNDALHDSSASPAAAGVTWPPDLREDADRPSVVSNYRIIEQIGAGGMGIVYRAEQVQPIRRIVALKLIKLGMDTREVVARFESERQALAMLEHAGIARVYDAGVTESGRPYFVMEHVPGKPITEYCDERRLTTSHRLELFERACHAVQHAHYKGILHRDLKPSNILVAEVDGEPQPKVIDFGVAKAMQPDPAESMLATRAGQLVGTPAYMSPEQAAGEAVDTRADVYSLGIVLYELLAGALPFADVRESRRDTDPPRPSNRLTTLGEQFNDVAARRGTEPPRLLRLVRGDLDLIVMKAIDRDPARRYGTPAALAEDVRRHLDHQPISARPPTLAYQARKFARRNRVLVTSVICIALALAAGSVVSTWQAIRATRAQRIATENAQRERAINTFLNDLFKSVNPRAVGPQPSMSVKDLLSDAVRKLDENYTPDARVESPLRVTIGNAFRGLGYRDLAEPQYRKAYEVARSQLGDGAIETIRAGNALSLLLAGSRRANEAEPIAQRVFESTRAIHGPDHRETLIAAHHYASVLAQSDRPDDAERMLRQVLADHERVLGPRSMQTLQVISNLGLHLKARGKLEEAEMLTRRGIDGLTEVAGPQHPITLEKVYNLGQILYERGENDAAEAVLQQALEGLERAAPDSPHAHSARSLLGQICMRRGDYAAAEPLFRRAYEDLKRVQGDSPHSTLILAYNLSDALARLGRYDEAERLCREVIDACRRTAPNAELLVSARTMLSWLLVRQGNVAAAEVGLRALHAEPVIDDPDYRAARLLASDRLVDLLYDQGRFDEAVSLQRELIEQCHRHARTEPEALEIRQSKLARMLATTQPGATTAPASQPAGDD